MRWQSWWWLLKARVSYYRRQPRYYWNLLCSLYALHRIQRTSANYDIVYSDWPRWGCHSNHTPFHYRVRLHGIWFAYGTGRGRTLLEATHRALISLRRSETKERILAWGPDWQQAMKRSAKELCDLLKLPEDMK